VLPERPLFSRDKIEPTASIVVKVRGSLEAQQVRAIRHLVASAVNGLKPEHVSIVDESGRLLASGSGDDATASAYALDERQVAMENRLRDQIESIISSIVGPGRARVQLSAEFDVNRITQVSDRFDPEGRVMRSSQTHEEQGTTADRPEGPVTVGNELPGTQRPGDATAAREQSKKSDETVNYEISRTTRTEVVEGGRVKRVSVAVLVDGTYAKTDKGDVNYQPRSKEEIDRIAALVRTAVGFDQKRGDQVEVINLRFAEQPSLPISEPSGLMALLQFTKDDVMRGAELLVMTLLALVVMLVVVRPLVRRIITPDVAKPALAADHVGILPGAAGQAADAVDNMPPLSSHASQMIDLAQVQGQVHAQSVQKVGELAERNPHETVAAIRQWLQDT
jgi:flagellar M-ring protein FliF